MWPSSSIPRPRRSFRISSISAGLLFSLLLTVGQAQVPTAIQPDGTLGTVVTPSDNIHTITGGTRPGGGPNLFHSFEAFSVGTGATARFSGPAGIANIVSRVTGGQLSTIDGRLQSEIAGANVYLLNPRGVLFGPNASLNVSGSFHVSTADFLRLADGATFFADLGRESVLTVAPPAAFGFLGNQPAPVTIQGSWLQVPAGQALSVVGGDIQLVGGTLRAPSGRLQLTSVASPGEVWFSPLEMAPDLQADNFTRLGPIELSQGTLLNTSSLSGGGTVLIRAGRLLVDRASIRADTEGDVHGASLGVDLRVTGEALLRNDAIIGATAQAGGRGGGLRLAASELHLDGARIEAGALGDGDVGSIEIRVERFMPANGGQVRNLTGMADRTEGRGRAGDLTVVATEAISISGLGA
jgi:filamentous hemagglutinin family protein